MEVRIYEIEKNAVSKVKSILESTDKSDIELKCQKCEKTETKTIDAGRLTSDESNERFEKANPCTCGGPTKIVSSKISYINELVRNGYGLHGAQAIEVEKDSSFLYIKADEDFFRKNEKLLMIEGVKKMEGNEMEKIKNKIEELEEKALEGFGGIFG
ncbi:MAG: hypothetical protein V1818_04370 [Candidatus Aenigmatarchaeota archaeon]